MSCSRRFFLGTALAGLLPASCRKPSASGPALAPGMGRPKVYVDNYPMAYFSGRIGGPEVEVVFPAPEDGDPAFWMPEEKDLAGYQSADLILLNGATYAKWVDKVTLPESKVVQTAEAFRPRWIEVKDAVTHSHGKGGEHSHGGIAFTTWLDFDLAVLQADAIREALQKLRPEQMELFALNFDQLRTDLLALDAGMKQVGARLAGKPLVASHPVYQYWARRYEINLRAVLWEPETVPDDVQMEDLRKILASHPAQWMIWEGEPDAASVKKLDEMGIVSVVFDPCGNVPESGTWLEVMKKNLEALKQIE